MTTTTRAVLFLVGTVLLGAAAFLYHRLDREQMRNEQLRAELKRRDEGLQDLRREIGKLSEQRGETHERQVDLERKLDLLRMENAQLQRRLDDLTKSIQASVPPRPSIRTEHPPKEPARKGQPAIDTSMELRSQKYLVRAIAEFKKHNESATGMAAVNAMWSVLHNPQNKKAYLYLVSFLMAGKSYQEAAEILHKLMSQDPDWISDLPDVIKALEDVQGYQNGLKALANHLEEKPRDVDALLIQAFIEYSTKGPAYTRALLEKTLQIDPNREEVKKFMESLEK